MKTVRDIRGWILRIVDRGGRFGASVQLIGDSLFGLRANLTQTEIEDELDYLVRKGYVRLEEVRVKGVGERRIAYVEPKGQDLLDGSIPADPGILLE
jgi:hypothetical protein